MSSGAPTPPRNGSAMAMTGIGIMRSASKTTGNDQQRSDAYLRAQWRIVYVALMFVASAATPDWSPWTMGGLFAALVVLYELSMLLARITLRKRIAAQKKAEMALYEEDDSDDSAS